MSVKGSSPKQGSLPKCQYPSETTNKPFMWWWRKRREPYSPRTHKTEKNQHQFWLSISTGWWSFICEGIYCKKLIVTMLKKRAKKARGSVTDIHLANAPSLTLLTAHKHFHQFEILEALRLPKDATCKCSFWTKYNFARCLTLCYTLHTQKHNVLP